MAVTSEQIAEVRRKVAESTEAIYNDALITKYIEKYPLPDSAGVFPENGDWAGESYDLNRAAADIWDEKANALTEMIDFQADGGGFTRSQLFEHAAKRARHYRSMRAMGTIHMQQYPSINIDLDEGVS